MEFITEWFENAVAEKRQWDGSARPLTDNLLL